jgi:hypothetical protein
MQCEERSQLLAEYEVAVTTYSHAVTMLHNLVKNEDEEFLRLWERAADAYRECQGAQRRLSLHVGAHRCSQAEEAQAESSPDPRGTG